MRRINKVLIANRGEIACRIARTCRRLGIQVATVHSSVDRWARHVREIGESIELGGAASSDSYLDIDAIVAAAKRVGADAVHPGYGFVAENADFVRALDAAKLIFIGPTADTIEGLGGKARAKAEAEKRGIPVVPGSKGAMSDPGEVAALVRGMKLPALIKAVAGGGGRGMTLVESLDDLEVRIESAMREAQKAFGDGQLIVERYLPRVRHIEVQIAGDGHGNVIHLFERECSLQRRHQKVVEEAPSVGLPHAMREALLANACRLAAGLDYRGLGTVEFIVSGDDYYFLEVNPRLQVEHPVTEEITGLDLVEMQLSIANDGRLPITQNEVHARGHAIEARVCAEDAQARFLPATGKIALAEFPESPIRVESGVASGDEISPYYNSMIAKLIAHGESRDDAIDSLLAGLRRTTVVGLTTNLEFLQDLLTLDEVRRGDCHTRLIDERWNGTAVAKREPPAEHLCAAALLCLMRARAGADLGCWTQWSGFTGWRYSIGPDGVGPQPAIVLKSGGGSWPVRFSRHLEDGAQLVAFGDRTLRTMLRKLVGDRFLLQCDGRTLELTMMWAEGKVQLESALGADVFDYAPYLEGAALVAPPSGQLTAPMMGMVVKVNAGRGERVVRGQAVLILESMKMELHVCAPHDGVVKELRCRAGDMVERSAVLAVVAAEAAPAAPASG